MFENDEKKNVVVDFKVDVTFNDRTFHKKQLFKNEIRIITTSFKIRGLNTHKHKSHEYVICNIYLKNIKNDKSITFVLRRKIYLVNNFKINMFINNNIINAKNLIINSVKKETFIFNINVIIFVKVKSIKSFIRRFVYIRKTIVISSMSEIIVFIHHTSLSKIKNFLFESIDDVNFTLYVYLMNIFITAMIVRNNHRQLI